MVSLRLDMNIPRWDYRVGEAVEVEVILRNVGQRAVNLNFRTSQVFDLVVKRSGGETIYVWSQGRVFTQVINEFHLEAGEALKEKLSWLPAEAGRYELEGRTSTFVADTEEMELETSPKSVTVQG